MYIWAESKPTSERVFLDKQWILGRAGLAGSLVGIWLEQNTICVGSDGYIERVLVRNNGGR